MIKKLLFCALIVPLLISNYVHGSKDNLDDQTNYYQPGVTYHDVLISVIKNSTEVEPEGLFDWVEKFSKKGSGDINDVNANDHATFCHFLNSLPFTDKIKPLMRDRLNEKGKKVNRSVGYTLGFTYGYACSILQTNSYTSKQRQYI